MSMRMGYECECESENVYECEPNTRTAPCRGCQVHSFVSRSSTHTHTHTYTHSHSHTHTHTHTHTHMHTNISTHLEYRGPPLATEIVINTHLHTVTHTFTERVFPYFNTRIFPLRILPKFMDTCPSQCSLPAKRCATTAFFADV